MKVKKADPAAAMAAKFAAAGFPCEIEAATRGLIVYASSKEHVQAIARDIALAVRPRTRVVLTDVLRDEDEPPATCWWTAIEFDWKEF